MVEHPAIHRAMHIDHSMNGLTKFWADVNLIDAVFTGDRVTFSSRNKGIYPSLYFWGIAIQDVRGGGFGNRLNEPTDFTQQARFSFRLLPWKNHQVADPLP